MHATARADYFPSNLDDRPRGPSLATEERGERRKRRRMHQLPRARRRDSARALRSHSATGITSSPIRTFSLPSTPSSPLPSTPPSSSSSCARESDGTRPYTTTTPSASPWPRVPLWADTSSLLRCIETLRSVQIYGQKPRNKIGDEK